MRIRKLGIYSGTELIVGGRDISQPERAWRKHVIDRPGALLSLRNRGEIFFGDTAQPLEAGDMVCYDALPCHEFRSRKEWSYYYLHFPAGMLPEEWNSRRCNTPVPGVRLVHFSNTELARIKREFQEAHTLFELRRPGWEMLVAALIQLILTRFFLTMPKSPAAGKSRLEVALPLLDVYGGSRNLKEIARSCGMSLSNFFRKFRSEYNCSPIEYRDNQVIAHAKILLCSTELQIKEIARELNFDDPYYFSRFFHARTGNTPSQYRKRHGHALCSSATEMNNNS